MSGPMVLAILGGHKTQTRRLFKLPRNTVWYDGEGGLGGEREGNLCHTKTNGWWHVSELLCPYGTDGEMLWVRETWRPGVDERGHGLAVYKADGSARWMLCDDGGDGDPVGIGSAAVPYVPEKVAWRPGIYMPRWASRISLRITSIRIERLNEISEEDAEVEGSKFAMSLSEPKQFADSARIAFAARWEALHGPGSWSENPWVWAIGFERA